MSDSFSPLFGSPLGGAGGSARNFRVQVVGAGSPALTPTAALAVSHAPCDPAKPVKVSLEKNGDTVTGIRIDCGCGQVIQLECVY
jgi:hypothetical protein